MTDPKAMLPCPFCGKPPESFGSGEGQRGLMIECVTPDCVNPHTSYYDHASAIRTWNRRTTAQPPEVRPAAGAGLREAAKQAVRDEAGSKLCLMDERTAKRVCYRDRGSSVCLCESVADAILALLPHDAMPTTGDTNAR